MQRSNSITMKKITSPPPTLDKKPQKPPKLSSKLTHWPSNAEERKKLYNKYCASKERLSYQFLELMIIGEDIFIGVTKQIFKRAYAKADELGPSQAATHGTITRRKFPYFLKYLLYFTDLWKVFDKMDNDKTTKLSLDKFTKGRVALDKDLTKQRAEEIYREMDKDGDGSVGFDDFCNWLLRQPKVLHYDNQKFFTVDFSNGNEDEDLGDIDVTPKNEEMKEMKEGVKEEETEEEVNEIDVLKARIRELEDKIIEQDSKYKLLLESESELKKSIENQIKENEEHKIQITDLDKNLQESIAREQNSKSELDKILGLSPECLALRTLLQDEHKGIMLLELNDFSNNNTLSSQLVIDLSRSIDFIKRNAEVRCVILKSKISGIFCSGSALKNLEVPTIVSIDGPALGLALELALTADIRIASKSVILGPTEASFGLLSEAGGTQRLPRLIGTPLAKELVFTGRTLSSEEALQYGIINYVEENGERNFSKSIEIAKQICKNETIAVKMAKEAMNYGSEYDMKSGRKKLKIYLKLLRIAH